MATVPYKRINVMLVGDSRGGKTTLSNMFVHNRFDARPLSGIGVNTLRKSVDILRLTIHILDTAGTERFNSLLPNLIRSTDCVMIVYDMNNLNTFQSVKDVWLDYVTQHGPEHVVKVLVANKSDINMRAVTEAEGRDLAEIHYMLYFETSAKLRINVDEMFTESGHYLAKSVEKLKVTLQIWDTAGMERYRFLLPHSMRDAGCAVIVYDMTCRDTFLPVRDTWLDYVKQQGSDNIVKLLVAKKSDLDWRAVEQSRPLY